MEAGVEREVPVADPAADKLLREVHRVVVDRVAPVADAMLDVLAAMAAGSILR